jgi:hypothetical protein
MVHREILEEVVRLLDFFKVFVFDFSGVTLQFNSIIAGFVLAMTRRLLDEGVDLTFKNLARSDFDVLRTIGLLDLAAGRVKFEFKD